MSWEDVENAMQSAFSTASRLDSRQVVWTYQDVDDPSQTFITIEFGGPRIIGIDRLDVSTDLTRPLGTEIKLEVQGVREVPFEVQCFTPQITNGANAARQLLEVTRSRLLLPSVRGMMRTVGISPFDPGPIDWIPDLPSVNFRGRAKCTIRCYVPLMDCIEYTAYIARVTGTVFTSPAAGVTGVGFPFDSNIR